MIVFQLLFSNSRVTTLKEPEKGQSLMALAVTVKLNQNVRLSISIFSTQK